jgi:hypothetical protein
MRTRLTDATLRLAALGIGPALASFACLFLVAAGACVPEYGQRRRLAEIEVRQLKDATDAFHRSTGRWPSPLSEMAPPQCQDGGCTLRELRRDPWENTYVLVLIVSPDVVSVLSAGADGRVGTDDDITAVVWQRP